MTCLLDGEVYKIASLTTDQLKEKYTIMQIIFAIPTWNRAEQLLPTLNAIVREIELSGISAAILISDNHSDDDTGNLLEKIKNQYPYISVTKPTIHVGGIENYESVLAAATHLTKPGDYIWSFGDDDDIALGSLTMVADCLKYNRPYFASVGNSRLPPHRFIAFNGNLREIVLKFGFFLTVSFISQCIYSHELALEIVSQRLITTKFSHDSYGHGSAILYLGASRPATFIDAPISTYRVYNNQQQNTQKRWRAEGVYDGIFNFITTVQSFSDDGLLPRYLDRRFFRYWRWHFWDFLIATATAEFTLDQKSERIPIYLDKVLTLANFLEDRELAKRLRVNVILHRKILERSVGNSILLNELTGLYEGYEVYQSFLGEF